MHILAQFACMPRILLTDTPIMIVVEKTAVEARVSRSSP